MSKERMQLYLERLKNVTEKVEEKLQNSERGEKLTGTAFENIVYQELLDVGFEKEEIFHSTQKFPDFILRDLGDEDKIGVEVKKTDSAKWEVIGGSIYESLKNEIEDTYVLMAKLGGEKPEVRLRRYESCIADLRVTHSPRFYLNLDLQEGEDYLTQNEAKDLLMLSGDELNRKIRKLLRTQKSTWWSEGETIGFSELSKEEKNVYLNEGIALFPEIFKGDYRKFTPWLVYSCFVWCGNVRDIFSAGGNKYVDEIGIYVSAVMNRALENSENVKDRIIEMTEEEQRKFWGETIDYVSDRIEKWIQLVEENLKISTDLLNNNRELLLDREYSEEQIKEYIKDKFINLLRCKIGGEQYK